MMKIFENIDKTLLIKLMVLHTVVIALSNFLVNYKFNIFGSPVAWSTLTYPFIFISTDLTVRLIGKEMGRNVVGVSFIPGILASAAVILASGAPDSVAWRIAAASGTSYLITTLLDVYAFQYLREKVKAWWVAPLVSGNLTMALSTYIFFALAFIGSANAFMAENWFIVATNGVIGKLLFGSALIVPVYGIVLNWILGKQKQDEPAESQQ
jgi:queuosine precursor transporter